MTFSTAPTCVFPSEPQTTLREALFAFSMFLCLTLSSVHYQILRLQVALCQLLKVLNVIRFVLNIIHLTKDLVFKELFKTGL